MLDLTAIARALGPQACRFDIDLLPVCDSTNAVLLARGEQGAPAGSVVVAEIQTAGRGRRGRPWFAAPGDSLTFSLLWRFPPGTSPAGLSLAVGLAVVRALDKLGAGRTARLALKWPNDVLMDGLKLAGILIELLPGATHAAVIGIGVNLRRPANLPVELCPRAAALGGECPPDVLLAALLGELFAALQTFTNQGFAGLRGDWMACHAHQDQPVCLLSDFAPAREGICRGVDGDGALLFEVDGRIERVLSGEVSLRGTP